LEKIDLSKDEDVLGRNPLEEELDSIWGVPKRKKKSVAGIEKVMAVKGEPQILHGKPAIEQVVKKRDIPAEAVKEIKIEALPEPKEHAVTAQSQTVMPKEEKEDDKGIEKTVQMVGFKLDKEFYGIDIIQVQEIIRMHEITMVPRTPPFVKGVVNLRGKVVPIISLRERFGIKEIEPTKETRIIIVRIDVGVIGFIVDAVSEVIRISERLIEPPPATATNIETEYIKGIGKLEDNLLIVLDLNKVLTKEKREFLNF
jgi:purine-binding chemotaxis protein CheW